MARFCGRSVMPSIDQFIVWVVVGLLGGSLAALVTTRDRKGYGLLRNLGVGLVGALVGGFLFRLLGLWPGLDSVAVSLRDVVAAVVGSLIVLAALWLWQRSKTDKVGLAVWMRDLLGGSDHEESFGQDARI